MIDTEFETYITGLVKEAYPTIRAEHILYRYPDSTFEQGKNLVGATSRNFGTWNVIAQVNIDTKEKIDRDLFVKQLPTKKPLKLDGKTVRLVLTKIIQKDFLAVYELQGTVFVFNFRYEIQED